MAKQEVYTAQKSAPIVEHFWGGSPFSQESVTGVTTRSEPASPTLRDPTSERPRTDDVGVAEAAEDGRLVSGGPASPAEALEGDQAPGLHVDTLVHLPAASGPQTDPGVGPGGLGSCGWKGNGMKAEQAPGVPGSSVRWFAPHISPSSPPLLDRRLWAAHRVHPPPIGVSRRGPRPPHSRSTGS